jgi:ribosomal protein S18 acetylase RimI-like enzyme
MNQDMIKIQRSLPNEFRARAIEIYFDAFQRKFAPLMDRASALAVLPDQIATESVFCAFAQNQLVGLAFIQADQKLPFNLQREKFTRAFGWLTGWYRYTAMTLFERTFQPSQPLGRSGYVYVDALCVDAAMRGNSVGTLLLNAVFEFAKTRGSKSVWLEVVDTNTRARKLYARLGFVAVKTHHYPLVQSWMGFTAATEMVKALE